MVIGLLILWRHSFTVLKRTYGYVLSRAAGKCTAQCMLWGEFYLTLYYKQSLSLQELYFIAQNHFIAQLSSPTNSA